MGTVNVAERTLQDFNLDLAIIGIDGIHPTAGLTTYDTAEAFVNRVMLGRAREVWVLADHSKIGQVRPAIVTGTEKVDVLITDKEAKPDVVAGYRKAGISLIN